MFHHVWLFFFVLFVFFYFWTFVTLWWWRDVMWRWVLYYFCTFVYKPVKKSLNSNPMCMHRFLPLSPRKSLGNTPLTTTSPSLPPPMFSKPCPTQILLSLLLSFIWPHPFTAGIKEPWCIVGRLSLKKGPLPCVCCGRAGFMLHPPTHTQETSQHTLLLTCVPFLMSEEGVWHHFSSSL